MAYIDFEQLKKQHSIESVAERLGLKLKKSGDTLRGKCPSGDGGDRGFVITPAKGVFYSFAQETGGDVISLVAFVQKVDAKTAAAWIQNGDTIPEKTPEKTTETSEGRGFQPLDYLEPEHAAVEALGFDTEDAKRIGIGYAPRGILRGQVAVPVRLEDGTLAGYIGVQEAKLPKSWRF